MYVVPLIHIHTEMYIVPFARARVILSMYLTTLCIETKCVFDHTMH